MILIIFNHLYAQSNQQLLKDADSLYFKNNWSAAKEKYIKFLKDSSQNNLAWMRLGYCNHNLGKYDEAIKDYTQSLLNKPTSMLAMTAESRLARVYALQNKKSLALQHLDSAASAGFFNVVELDTCRDYANIRDDAKFKTVYQQVYAAAYPCAVDPKAREFDFWIGEWDVYATGSSTLVGHSIIQKISEGCAILENWTSNRYPYSGKSINYYDGDKKKWEQVWVGSGGVEPPASDVHRFFNGEYKDSAMHFTFTTTVQGKPAIGNFIFYNLGKDKVRQYQETSVDDGKTYQVVYDFTYLRK